MGFRNFKFNLILRVASLALTIYLFAYLSMGDTFFLTQGLILALVIFQVVSLINFLNKTNKEIAGFLNSIKYDDFSHTYSTRSSNSSVDLLNREFNKVIKKFREIRAEKEAQHHYLKTIVQHVGIGIITFDKKGDIQIINSAAKKLLNISQIKSINQMRSMSEPLVDSFFDLKTGGRDLVKIEKGDNNVQLAIYAIELSLSGEDFKLVSLQNIQSELEEKEMEAWQNLIRVLTHEIMNSITPISSLAAIVEQELEQLQKDQDFNQNGSADIDDIHLAIQTIHKRSAGLIRFVSDFRNLTRIPAPKFATHLVKEIFDQIITLLKFELEKCNVEMQVEIEPDTMELQVDRELMEQVLINLIKNAIQALESDDENQEKTIVINSVETQSGEAIITVKDNGPGIESEALSKIFIPFFTTKKNGSGIGLSLSKQIIRKHHGNLSVKSTINEGTEFTIKI